MRASSLAVVFKKDVVLILLAFFLLLAFPLRLSVSLK